MEVALKEIVGCCVWIGVKPGAIRSRTSKRPQKKTASGGNAAECYHFDTKALQPPAEQDGPTPEDLGQTGDDLQKWEELAAAGRPWLTGKEALELPVRD